MSSIYIDDGYTAEKTVPAVPGLYPELRIVYRPALARERYAWAIRRQAGDATSLEQSEAELIAKYTVSVNGDRVTREQAGRLKPAVRVILTDLILGYSPEDEAKDAKNSSSG